MEERGEKMKEDSIPGKALERLKTVSEKRGIPFDKVLEEYKRVLGSKKVQKQKGDEEGKKIWASRIVFTNFMTKEPASVHSLVIPFGIIEPRLKKGAENKVENMRASLFAAVRNGNDKKFEVKEIVFNGKLAPVVQKIKLLRAYKNVKLYDRGYFIEAGEDTKFENPQKVKMTEEQILTGICKFPKLERLIDTVSHRSDYNGGYIDRTDMYLIEGMVKRKFGKGYGIKDESLPLEEKAVRVGDEKVVVPQVLTVWVPKRFYRWDTDAELAFLGTIDIGRDDRRPFMNAVLVYVTGFAPEL